MHEISNHVSERNKDEIIETRAQHIISSAIFLLESIKDSYPPDEYEQLTRRFFSSIKGSDPGRFSRAIKKVKEGKNNAK